MRERLEEIAAAFPDRSRSDHDHEVVAARGDEERMGTGHDLVDEAGVACELGEELRHLRDDLRRALHVRIAVRQGPPNALQIRHFRAPGFATNVTEASRAAIAGSLARTLANGVEIEEYARSATHARCQALARCSRSGAPSPR